MGSAPTPSAGWSVGAPAAHCGGENIKMRLVSAPSLLQDLREELLPQKVILCSIVTPLPRTQ